MELVLYGHDHDYERFAPQNPDGVADPVNDIRKFVVGTGGKSLRTMGTPSSNRVVHDDNTCGVIELTLHSKGFEWNLSLSLAGRLPIQAAGPVIERSFTFCPHKLFENITRPDRQTIL